MPEATRAGSGTSKVGRLGRDVVLRIAVRVAAAALQALTLLLLARVLGPERFGVFAVFFSTGVVLTSLVTVGATGRLLRLLAEPDRDTLVPALFWVQAVGSAVVLAGLIGTAIVVGDVLPAVVGAVFAFSDQQAEFVSARLSGSARQSAASVVILVQRLVPAAAALVMITLWPAPWLPGLACAVVSLGLLGRGATRPVPFAALVSCVRSSVGFWFSAVVVNLRQLEPVVVAGFGGTGPAGAFAIASRVSNPLGIVVTSMQAIAVPEMARASSAEELRKTFRLLLAVAGVYAAVLVAASPLLADLFLLVLGEQFASARVLIAVMVVCAALSAISQAFQARLYAVGLPSRSGWIVGLGTVTGLALLAVTAGQGGQYLWVAPLTTQALIVIAFALTPAPFRGPADAAAHPSDRS
jgi:O-antigen/teichoic acid export membrane protein